MSNKERYRNDPLFHTLVDEMLIALQTNKVGPADLIEAAEYATEWHRELSLASLPPEG